MNSLIPNPPYIDNPIQAVDGQSFVVTGAAGSIGSEVCRRLCSEGAHVTGVDIDENGLTYLCDDCGPAFTPHVSDIAEWGHNEAFVGTGTYIHCAARKHVALGEMHPAEYKRVNVLGTVRVIQAAAIAGARMVLVSTDKAVNPTCVMGRTKRRAELLTLAFGQTVVRLVNVYGSRGSVVPRWHRQVDDGQPCTITDWEHRRFYMSPRHAAWTIIDAATSPSVGCIAIPSDFAELTTRELFEAEFPEPRPETIVIGARPGERDHEELRHPFETGEGTLDPGVADLARYRTGEAWELVEV